jgi:branched-chain amino acid transport system permease protein
MIEELKLFVEVCFTSLPVGSMYALLALSYVLISKGTKVLNLCQGEIMMIGAYICYSLMELQLSLVNAIIISVVLTSCVAFLLERFIMRKVMNEPVFVSVMVTLGVGIFLRGLVGVFWGVDQKKMTIPNFDTAVTVSGFFMNYGKLSAIIMAIVFIIVLELFFKVSKRGMAMKATASNLSASMLMGVNVRHMFSLSWVLAAVISVFPGIFLAKLIILEPTISLYGLVALSVLVLGGMESIVGTIIAGYAIGIAEGISGFYIGGQSKNLVGFVIMFLILMIRPTGLFGIKKVERV